MKKVWCAIQGESKMFPDFNFFDSEEALIMWAKQHFYGSKPVPHLRVKKRYPNDPEHKGIPTRLDIYNWTTPVGWWGWMFWVVNVLSEEDMIADVLVNSL